MILCWVPLILLGYSYTIETSWHQSANVDAPYVQVQSCKDGLGVHGMVSAAPWASGGVHYGFTKTYKKVSMTLQPKLGLGYFNHHHPVNRQRQIGRFEVGLAAMVQVERYVLSVEYTHLSNGEGWKPTNIGLDLVGVQMGMTF